MVLKKNQRIFTGKSRCLSAHRLAPPTKSSASPEMRGKPGHVASLRVAEAGGLSAKKYGEDEEKRERLRRKMKKK